MTQTLCIKNYAASRAEQILQKNPALGYLYNLNVIYLRIRVKGGANFLPLRRLLFNHREAAPVVILE